MKRYSKHVWDEPRGDQYDHWGSSTWYFELDDEGWPVRQIILYEAGVVLTYDRTQFGDTYGGLGDQKLEPTDEESHSVEISAEEFERLWRDAKPLNRK